MTYTTDTAASAIDLNYARALELAIEVFCSQKTAETGLIRPCAYFGEELLLDMLTTATGFKTMKVYLQKLSYGLYV